MRLILIAAALSLSACQTPLVIGGVDEPVAVSDTIVIKSTDALSLAADSYAMVSRAIETAVRAGAFNDDQLRMIRVLNNHALALLEGTDKTLTQAQRAASLLAAVGQLRSILVRK